MKEKYTKITVRLLIWIPIVFCLFLADQLLLPQKTIKDHITAYSEIVVRRQNKFSNGSAKELIGIKYFTEKGYEFSLDRIFIEEPEITIKKSYLFQNINSVQSKNHDYSDKLVTGLNGACFYFALGLTLTSVISLLLLKFHNGLSENGFQNILLTNIFLLFVAVYTFYLYS